MADGTIVNIIWPIAMLSSNLTNIQEWYVWCSDVTRLRGDEDQGWIQQGFSRGGGGGGWVSGPVFLYNSLRGGRRAFKWIGFLMTWAFRKILKIRTLEMPFPAIWALNYELQFDFKKRKTLEIVRYFRIWFFAPRLTKANRGAHPCPPL